MTAIEEALAQVRADESGAVVPSWAPDPSLGQRMINARSETLLEKPSFKQAVDKRRCLVPANGFYEWRRDGKRKIPMWIQFKTREPFAFPGLWDCWIDRDTANRYTASRSLRHTPMHSYVPFTTECQ